MKIDVAYGRDLDVSMLEQLLCMEADACVFYSRIGSDSNEAIVGIIPTETAKHFKRRMASTLFFMKTKKTKSGKDMLVAMACLSKHGKANGRCLHTVYVKPSCRGKGIGKAIVKAAMSMAKKEGWHLSLGVNPLNKVAMHLYESLGFKTSQGQSVTMEFNGLEKKCIARSKQNGNRKS